jgi:hypothetical protein
MFFRGMTRKSSFCKARLRKQRAARPSYKHLHALPPSLAVYSILIDYSVSEARATAKLAEENSKKAEMSLVEESCKMGETQRRCGFLETKVRKECEEAKKVGLKTDLLEAELGKVKKEIEEREDTYVSPLVSPPHLFRS